MPITFRTLADFENSFTVQFNIYFPICPASNALLYCISRQVLEVKLTCDVKRQLLKTAIFLLSVSNTDKFHDEENVNYNEMFVLILCWGKRSKGPPFTQI